MKKLLFIFGTRPEFIKVYPVIQEAKRQGNPIVLVNTGQHKEMLNELLDEFSVEVDYDLKIMEKYSGLSEIVAGSISGLDPIIKKEQLVKKKVLTLILMSIKNKKNLPFGLGFFFCIFAKLVFLV